MRNERIESLGLNFLDVSFTFEEVNRFMDLLSVKPGDVVLDMFAGTGTTCLLLSILGIETICIEIDEDHFRYMEDNLRRIDQKIEIQLQKQPQLILGDAEYVSLNRKIDKIITSPPFTISQTKQPFTDWEQYCDYIDRLGRIFQNVSRYLNKENKVLVEMGNDVFMEELVPLRDMLKEKLRDIGFVLVETIERQPSNVASYYLIFEYRPKEN